MWMAGLNLKHIIVICQQTNQPELAYHVIHINLIKCQVYLFVEHLVKLVDSSISNSKE